MHNVHIDHSRSVINERLLKIKNKILVISNKGGVGKSSVAVLLSYSLVRKGFSVGLLDADIHGPSIAKMTGVENEIHKVDEKNNIYPVEKNGIRIVSMGSITKNFDKAFIWRGPIKHSIIKQLLTDVEWGGLDYLVIDLPPGTGDEVLSVCQLIGKVDGAVVVTTSSKVSLLDVSKAVDFLNQMNIKVYAMIENMSYLKCPYCKKEIELFGKSDDINRYSFPLIKLPFEKEVSIFLDNGTLNGLENTESFKIISSLKLA